MENLRRARGSRRSDDPAQAVVDRILAGPPYPIDEITEQALPYWLQAVRWFDGVAPGLPTPAALNRSLERRRIRSRLGQVVTGFRGRRAELGLLHRWYQKPSGPLTLSGPGGIGKSALVARFALELPANTVLLWLDFDRADLAPDDPASVLRQLAAQLALQIEAELPAWPEAANDTDDARDHQVKLVANALAAAPEPEPPLLIMDGFEIAQHSAHHEQIWTLVSELVAGAPRLRVLISGRAPIDDLRLGNQLATVVRLEGVTDQDATDWLAEQGVHDLAVIAVLLRITGRIPLSLRLTVRLLDEGIPLDELPEMLPQALVDGYLYQRILERVISEELRDLVRDALAVRIINAGMIAIVFADDIPTGWTAEQTFTELVREFDLVGSGVTELGLDPHSVTRAMRPEVRRATLQLLQVGDSGRVRLIDQRAADWYATQLANDRNDRFRAELVYHLLRVGDLPAASRTWRDGCAQHLFDAEQDFPPDADDARTWLVHRTKDSTGGSSLISWEHDVVSRIHDLVARGHTTLIEPLLRERPNRSLNSPLVALHAWAAWLDGRITQAEHLLAVTPAPDEEIEAGRVVMRALVARSRDRVTAADDHLARAQELLSRTRPTFDLDLATLWAARVCVMVDLRAESRLALLADGWTAKIQARLPATDVVLPPLLDRLASPSRRESLGERLRAPSQVDELYDFADRLDHARGRYLSGYSHFLRVLSGGLEHRFPIRDFPADRKADPIELAEGLAERAVRRWQITVTTTLLHRAMEEIANSLDRKTSGWESWTHEAVISCLGAFPASDHGQLNLWWDGGATLDQLLKRFWHHELSIGQNPAEALLDLMTGKMSLTWHTSEVLVSMRRASDHYANAGSRNGLLKALDSWAGDPNDLISLCVLMAGPDPLAVVSCRLLGIVEG
jgi:hypothetical protein